MRRLAPVLSLSILIACSSTGNDGDGGDAPEGCVEPAGQQLSDPCCPAHGPDACETYSFCASLDGLTQPICYQKGTRPDNTECDADFYCESGSCNTVERKCRPMVGTACTPEVGCAPTDPGGRAACANNGTCQWIGDGNLGAVCADSTDCVKSVCEDARCMPDLACTLPGSGIGPCITPSYYKNDDAATDDCWPCLVLSDCTESCSSEREALSGCWPFIIDERAVDVLARCETQLCDYFGCVASNCNKPLACF